MKKIIAILLALALMLSVFTVSVCADGTDGEGESGETEYYFENGYAKYNWTSYGLTVPGAPKTIKGTWDYDENLAEICTTHPDYGEDGVAFPIAEDDGALYNADWFFEGTVLYFEYTLKDGAMPEPLNNGSYSFNLLEVALKLKEIPGFGMDVTMFKLTDVVTVDGDILYKDGVRTGTGYGYQGGFLMPLEMPGDPTRQTEPTEAKTYLYKDKLLSQYGLSADKLTNYDEFYTHKDKNGETDWALVRAATKRQSNQGRTPSPYTEFGNRVMQAVDIVEPFAFGVGVFSVEHDCFFDLYAPELYELSDLERVWTEVGTGRLIGDMNGDDSLDVTDATRIQRCQVGLEFYPESDENTLIDDIWQAQTKYFSDFNGDGERDLIDATAIQRFLIYMDYRCADWLPFYARKYAYYPDPTEAQPTEPSDPSIPRITGFKSTGKGVEMTISAVQGAEKYRVYYYSNNGWTKLGETAGDTFIYEDAQIGCEYRYTVRCIKADLSEFTSDFDRMGWTYTYQPHLDKPHVNKVEAVERGLQVSWDAVDGADLYRAYYKTQGGSWTKIADVRSTSCILSGAAAGKEYTFTVRCLSSKGRGFASDYEQEGFTFYYYAIPKISTLKTRADGVELNVSANHCHRVRIYRKTSSGWKRLGEIDSDDESFTDTEVEPGKTYVYTARCMTADGSAFASWYDSGYSHLYSVATYVPEFEFVIYTGENMMLVQPKENKFGLTKYRLDIRFPDSGYGASAVIGSEPQYIRAAEIVYDAKFSLSLAGLNKNGDVITDYDEDGMLVYMLKAPDYFEVEKTGDRKYRFSWSNYAPANGENFNLISEDGKYIIDSGYMRINWYEVDLSDYPEDTKWNAMVWGCLKNEVCCSLPASMDFSEADYK